MNDPRRWLERWGVVILVAFLFLLELVLAYRIICILFSNKLPNQTELIILSVLIVVVPLLILTIVKSARKDSTHKYDIWESIIEHIDELPLNNIKEISSLSQNIISIIETGNINQTARYTIWESLIEHIDGLRLNDEKEVENLLKLFKEVVNIIETGDVRQSDSKEIDSGSAGLE